MTAQTAVEPATALVRAGAFAMGSDDGLPNEQPVHTVELSAFRIALLPVTNREFASFLAATGHEPPRFWHDAAFNAPEQPVVGVTWFDAADYCRWLSESTGKTYRLPTEAEREKAARGGVDGVAYPWGDGPGPEDGRFAQEAPFVVGRSQANGYGLRDMGYNVHEWCSDWYGATYYRRSPSRDPQGPEEGTRRSARGGAWRHQVKVSRCAARSSLDPTFQYNDFGFRVVLEA